MTEDKFTNIIKNLQNEQALPKPQTQSVDSNNQGLKIINEGLKIENYSKSKEGLIVETSTKDTKNK